MFHFSPAALKHQKTIDCLIRPLSEACFADRPAASTTVGAIAVIAAALSPCRNIWRRLTDIGAGRETVPQQADIGAGRETAPQQEGETAPQFGWELCSGMSLLRKRGRPCWAVRSDVRPVRE